MSKLDEIEARLKARECHASLTGIPEEEEFRRHAPADLVLLAGIVRMVAESPCQNSADDCGRRSGFYCWPCRVRAELAKEAGR